MNHKEHIEEIAKDAARLYGQDWDKLNTGSRDRWTEAVRNTTRGGGENNMDRIAGQAIDKWYKRQEGHVVEAASVASPSTETKPKKRGK